MNKDYEKQCNTAELKLAEGDAVKAIEMAHLACGSAPHQGRAYHIIGKALIAQEEWLSALETYELAWLLDPMDADANLGVGTVLGHLRPNRLLKYSPCPRASSSALAHFSRHLSVS